MPCVSQKVVETVEGESEVYEHLDKGKELTTSAKVMVKIRPLFTTFSPSFLHLSQ